MLTEREVARSWSRIFQGGNLNGDAMVRAEALLEELRPTSPLRLRLQNELEELRSRLEAEVEA